MPRLNKQKLLDGVVRSIVESGWQVIYLSTTHPFLLQVYNDKESYRILVYIWNISHGGKGRAPDEYRIQITPINKFESEPDCKTLILGWWEEVGVYAGFDFRKHTGLLGGSPSMQIRENYLRSAYEHGFSACNKGNREIAVAFKPEFLVEYIRNLEALHDFGKSTKELEILDAVAIDPHAVNESELLDIPQARRTAIISTAKTLRDTSFKQRVLTAYKYTCAICAAQLDLVEAAHIVPVAAEGSTDETSNGIAMCVLHHKAFDRALIAVDDKYRILVSEKERERLNLIGHDGGFKEFKNAIRPIIVLPPSISDRPHIEYLKRGREIRRWAI